MSRLSRFFKTKRIQETKSHTGWTQRESNSQSVTRRAYNEDRLINTSECRDKRIKIVQKMKEKILNNRRREIKIKIRNREHRVKMFSSKVMDNVTDKWIQNSTLKAILQEITQKFELRRQTRERVLKIGKQV
mmetsp:Transcript_15041/g.13199  ORF Transcript_15041/g.13199 Transcript_15041/m.13199 type:complete len:132 (+) Transcript_15041:725-1120(+)